MARPIIDCTSDITYRQGQELIPHTTKGRVHCFSMQVVMNKCFLLNPEKKFGADFTVFREKRKNTTLIPKNDVTEPKAKLL